MLACHSRAGSQSFSRESQGYVSLIPGQMNNEKRSSARFGPACIEWLTDLLLIAPNASCRGGLR